VPGRLVAQCGLLMIDRPDETFVPRSGIGGLADAALGFLNHHLTVVSVVMALVAVALLIAGPMRPLLRQPSPVTSVGGPLSAGLNVPGGAANTMGSIEALDRQLEPFTIIPDRPRNQVITYTVQPGDTLMGIAQAFGLDRNTLFWSNADTLRGDVHMLQPGMELAILPVDGVYYRADGEHSIQAIADEFGVDPQVILESEYNELAEYTPTDVPPWGMRIVVPGGVSEINPDLWKPPVVEVTDPVSGTVTRAFMPNMAGSCSSSLTGSGGTGAWANPLPGGTFVQPFYPGHSGIDLAAPVGTSVQAADSGVVIFSGWVPADWGYGVLVVLDHGNGWTTYYAHLSVNGVGCGAFVPRGGYVGQVGSTGNSTGPHLHFEMRWNHTPDNPAVYLGF